MEERKEMNLTKIIIASENKSKAEELRKISKRFFPNIEVLTPSEIKIKVNYPEEGLSYEENAITKAKAAANACGLPAVSDDSGIEVEALGGAPGALSARYGATDSERNSRLLSDLSQITESQKRKARYWCSAAIAFPNEEVITASGEWCGRIIFEPKGKNGFGFDPIFFDEELGKTAAELSEEEKSIRSHRGKALNALFEDVSRLSRS